MYAKNIRFYHVQALRFFAAAAVVLGHTMIFWSLANKGVLSQATVDYFGWAGGWSVSLFFAISGFVITHSSQGKSPVEFLGLRLLRIYPAFWMACLIAASVKLALWHHVPWAAAGYSVKSLSLLPFGTRPYPLMIEWSLIFEVFFYLLFTLFLFIPNRRWVLYLSVAWLCVIILAEAFGHDYFHRLTTFPAIALSNRNLPFIGGVLVYFFANARWVRPLRHFLPWWALAIAIFAQITVTAFWIDVTQAISSMMLLTWAIHRDHDRPLSSENALVRFGDASYGLYLIHITIITVLLNCGPHLTTTSCRSSRSSFSAPRSD